MKKIFSLTFIFVFTFFVFQNLYAQKPNWKWNNSQTCIEKLNLSEEQEKKINDIRFTHQEKIIDLNTKIRKNQLEIKKMISGDKMNETDIMKLADISSEIRSEIHKSKIKMWFDVNNILNDEQKIVWKSHFHNFGEGKFSHGARNKGHKDWGYEYKNKRFDKQGKKLFRN